MKLIEIKNLYKKGLTEGVDFKRAEWLIGDDKAKIEWYANLWINQLHTIIGKDKKKYIASASVSSLVLQYDKQWNNMMAIFRNSGTWHIADYSYSSMPDIVDYKFYINNAVGYCERDNVLFKGKGMPTVWNNNVKFSIYGGKMQILEEYDSANDKLISSLVPCQLLKPIPASLDANNRARQAGECGMYDSISGMFFGNVASSGTFSVEGEVEEGNESKLLQIYAKESNNSNSGTETNTGDPEYGGEL